MRPETAPASRPTGPFRLGEWEVRPQHNELVSGKEIRHLEPKTMDLLLFLASVAPDVVAKNTIIDSVWEGRIISEGTLTNTIAELRRALGDDARRPRYVETIPKRGYCLIEPVEPLPSGSDIDGDTPPKRTRVAVAVSTVAVMLALAVVMTIAWQTRELPLDPALVLVAPFVNRSGDQSLNAASLLIRDRMVSSLSESGLVEAVPAGSDDPSDAIDLISSAARESGAGLAIGGTIYLHEGKVELQAKLVDAHESALLYAVPAFIADRDRISDALVEVVQRSVGAVATHQRAHGHFQLMSHTPAFDAYQEFITGSELFATDWTVAIHHFERALELDPEFTSASLRLSVAYRRSGRLAEASNLLAQLDARRPTLSEFERLWLDYFRASQDIRRRDALALLRRIENSIPDDQALQHLIVGKASSLNRPEEVITAMSILMGAKGLEGLVHNPLLVKSYARCAISHHILGNHSEELRIAQKGLEFFPTHHDLLVAEARALTALGDKKGFEEVVTRILATPTGFSPANLLIETAATARAHGRVERARELAGRAIDVLNDRADPNEVYVEGWLRAQALVLADNLDQAQAVLEGLRSMSEGGTAFQVLGVDGWLGAVAARRGDLETAHAIDSSLKEYSGPYEWGWPSHYRAAIAAWLGHRDQAMDLLSQSQAEGWGSFPFFHDIHRVLFEPLEGMPEFEAILHPED